MDHPFDTHDTTGTFSYEDMFAYDDDEEEPELKIIQEDSNSYDYGEEEEENDDEEDTTLVDPDSFLQFKQENHLSVEDIKREDYESLNGIQSSDDTSPQIFLQIQNNPEDGKESDSEKGEENNAPAQSGQGNDPLEGTNTEICTVITVTARETGTKASSPSNENTSDASISFNSREKVSEEEYDDDDDDDDEEEEDFELDADELDSMLEEGMQGYAAQKKGGKPKAGEGEKTEGNQQYVPPMEKQKVVLVGES